MENIYGKKKGIIELKKKDFYVKDEKYYIKDNFINNVNGIIIVYAPWCSHCVLSKEMWINFADLFKHKFNIYALNMYNYNVNNNELVTPFDIHIYPSYKLINKKGEISNYTGRKNEDIFLKFILKKIEEED